MAKKTLKLGEILQLESEINGLVNPQTGKLDDRIFGVNKYLALGIGVAGVVALYYLFKRK